MVVGGLASLGGCTFDANDTIWVSATLAAYDGVGKYTTSGTFLGNYSAPTPRVGPDFDALGSLYVQGSTATKSTAILYKTTIPGGVRSVLMSGAQWDALTTIASATAYYASSIAVDPINGYM